MILKLSSLCLPLVALTLAFAPPAAAQDAMATDSMAMADPMATECIDKAEAETDGMKMDAMMAECAEMYPDAVAAHCYETAAMQADAMKKDEMTAACHEMYPDAMMPADAM